MNDADIDIACRLHERAVAARAEGKFAEAESLGLQALKLLEKTEGPEHPDVVTARNNLACVYEEVARGR